jgi:predicted glycosyl hydrolase (DUF1957 family)
MEWSEKEKKILVAIRNFYGLGNTEAIMHKAIELAEIGLGMEKEYGRNHANKSSYERDKIQKQINEAVERMVQKRVEEMARVMPIVTTTQANTLADKSLGGTVTFNYVKDFGPPHDLH